MTRSLIAVLGLAVGSGALLACGDTVDTSAQPHIGGERFEEIRFAELYRPADATKKDGATVDLVQTETMSVEGMSPEQLLTSYSKELTGDGWTEAVAPEAKRDQSWYGAWTKLGRNVVVTAELGTPETEGAAAPTDFELRFQRPTKTDQITGVGNDPIVG